ncbi:hypothetical protein PAXRUDRAFT_77320, partial [Paxillus rubicundulus Ve08.2h10]
ETNAWLKPEEEMVVAYCIKLAIRAFPLNHRVLKTHVDSILNTRIGASFPKEGVGKSWTQRFLERHSDCLGRYWSTSLDTACGCAVNENTHQEWCKLFKDIL